MEFQPQTETENKLEYPSNWNVIFWNDDVTPMGFVAYILKEIFGYNETNAFQLMMKIHEKGSAIAGSYLKSVAESKTTMASGAAEKMGFPLKITMEKAS